MARGKGTKASSQGQQRKLALDERTRVTGAAARTLLAKAPGAGGSSFRLAWLLPAAAGMLAAALLVALYLGLVSWAQGFGHARELLWSDRYFVAAIAGGFGLQVALFVHVRRLVARRAAGSAAGVTVAGTGTSTVAMVACCAHHVADALPVLGLSGAALFLNDYRIPLMAVGLAVNALGVAFMLRLVVLHTRRARVEAAAC